METMRQLNWVCYIVKCNDGTLYTGITNNVKLRIKAHNSGRGAKYCAQRLPVKLVFHTEPLGTRGHAAKYEAQVKKMSRLEKFELIDSHVNKHVEWHTVANMPGVQRNL